MAADAMASPISPPTSPNVTASRRPQSAFIRSSTRPRSNSRMSVASKTGTRHSDEDATKTSVRVAVRVRPPLKPTDPGYDLIPQRFRGSTCEITSPTSMTMEAPQGKKLFVFDRVFGEETDQEGVWEYLKESVNSFVQGYNVSVLAYGQSGAGKSYTMGTTGPGEQGDAKLMGVVPRAAAALFEMLSPVPKTGIRSPNRYSLSAMSAMSQHSKTAERNWKMTATYVEIYQEHLRDLLVDDSVPHQERPQVHIREDVKGRILLTGLRQVPINSIEDLLGALNFGSSIRQTDATAVNARSSRSHAVFSLNLVQKKGQAVSTSLKDKRRSMPLEAFTSTLDNWITVDSKLHFVDLAGSERLKNTGAHGERAKEGISINAGLASLGKVISQLSSRTTGTHISYRDSRLTRLLQDSLGGNAITYMVACVNPAEFHLSETLNTVQYAQRARAIQIKPQIQQIHDDSDKQAVIERLRAEVQFLRDQIRLSEKSERRSHAPQERAERSNEREIELQNQLLDIQENYSALSQRHARVIAEIAKSRDPPRGDSPISSDPASGSIEGRRKRSSDFAEAVEQVVLEYEKTIQSLEASLSNTRSSLSNSESTLLEKETKVAYMETLNSQLQSRLQKALDRETNDENYLRDLEARVAGASTDEEKSNALVLSLKQELTRIRESEAGAEDYISTLEERLAEAEQQHETMTREIERLEHVIERQRSINKLDNLLYDLDQLKSVGNDGPKLNGHGRSQSSENQSSGSRGPSPAKSLRAIHNRATNSLGGAVQEHLNEDDEFEGEHPPMINTSRSLHADLIEEPSSPAQTQFVNDKLETVTQELFDLRVEHESTVTDFEQLHNKYQMALTTMAELQDALEESRRSNMSRPVSFFKTDAIERSLSAELDEANDAISAAETVEPSEHRNGETHVLARDEGKLIETVRVPTLLPVLEHSVAATEVPQNSTLRDTALEEEMTKLRQLNDEKESVMAELKDNYKQLQDKHQDTLDYVDALKTEAQRANFMTGRSSPNPQIIRRKAERSSILSDRASHSFVAIRNLVHDTFEDDPEKAQMFENNVNTAMTEFQMRTERVQQLEGELGALRKEMESKTAIINGLTRERASHLKAAPIDMAALATLEQQVRESEGTIRTLQMSHATREQELQDQIDLLRGNLKSGSSTTRESGTFFDSEDSTTDNTRDSNIPEDHHRQLTQLQKEVASWRSKHDSALEDMKAHEKQLLATINDLQVKATEQPASRSIDSEGTQDANEAKEQLAKTITSLQHELEEHKSAAGMNAQRLAELESSYSKILIQVEDQSRSKELTEQELVTHRNLVVNLESQLDAHKVAIDSHQAALDALRQTHALDLERLKSEASNFHTETLAAVVAQHENVTKSLNKELEIAKSSHAESQESLEAERAELAKTKEKVTSMIADATLILNKPTNLDNLVAHIQALVNARKDIAAMHETASSELRMVQEELENLRTETTDSVSKITELKTLNEETMKELERVSDKELKSSRLVEELEEQLNTNFDQVQVADDHIKTLKSEHQDSLTKAENMRLELERELDDAKGRISQLETELNEARRALRDDSAQNLQRSNSANMRASTSPVNLPSPPPAIPLPPLPGMPGQSGSQQQSPPPSRHANKDIGSAHATQMAEDQEARIRTIEKHLFAEKQLTATLEEALTDLESSSTKMKTEMELWRRKCVTQEEELQMLRKEKQSARMSVQQMEDDAKRRIDMERQKLEERMRQLNDMNKSKKGKKSSLQCF